ncbi:PLP-dependent transferase [Lentibacter algarum]|uniref:PLP-dependent transferase n=1 Tax=Lentibacter algarum TaxID=576131 RepID=UPI0023A8FE2E|nr:PLP-dependent transferase [Lentibacter algarum]
MSLPAPIESRLLAMLHARTDTLEAGDPIPEPLVLSSAFALPSNPDARRTYARYTNPTIEATEARLAALEDAPCLLFPSGMGAYSAAFMALLKGGDRVLMLSDGYYAARNLVSDIMAPFGVVLETCPAANILTADLAGYAAVVVETPSNPGLDVIDLRALAERCRTAGAKLVPGFDIVADEVGLHEHINNCDFVITGEGFLDEESFNGKVVGGVQQLAMKANKPVAVICGDAQPEQRTRIEAISLVESYGQEAAIEQTLTSIEKAARELLARR